MASDQDAEKVEPLDPATAALSEAGDEKEGPGRVAEGAYGEPDPDHGEVEILDEGHLGDLARQRVSSSIRLANL